MSRPRHVSWIAVALTDDELPTRFRIFKAGINRSTKGDAVFDEAAAASVMKRYTEKGCDLLIDLNHDSLDRTAAALRADARDARGWFQLAVENGELWAVNVRWTPDGEERLRTKKQRFISPAFDTDEDDRVTWLANVALCGDPAILDAPPLVAASQHAPKRWTMDPEIIKAALEALKTGDAKAALGVLEELLLSVTGAAPAPSEEPPAEALAEGAAPPVPAVGEDPDKALAQAVRQCTGGRSDAVTVRWLSSVATRLDRLDANQKALDMAQRRDHIAELIKLGSETPATAWEGDATKRVPVLRLLSEDLDGLADRVEKLRAAAPVRGHEAPKGPAVQLTASEEAKAAGMTPAARARFVAARMARRAEKEV